MDGTTFDDLIKRLATTPLSRSKVLRGLAAGTAALAGARLAAEPGAAKGKRKICHCTDEKPTSCRTIEVGKKAARRHVRRHNCDYGRPCDGHSGCCFTNTQACTEEAQCCSGFCGDGTCRPADCSDIGISCTSGEQCCSGNCLGNCVPCKSNGTTCVAGSECCSGICSGTPLACQP